MDKRSGHNDGSQARLGATNTNTKNLEMENEKDPGAEQNQALPGEHGLSSPTVTWRNDGSVTLDAVAVECLIDTLKGWAQWKGWTRREDCQNWKRSPIARENRRESIVYGNCLEPIMTLFGRKEIRKRMEAR